MKHLMTVGLVLATLFASTFLLVNATGLMTLNDIERWLEQASQINPLYLSALVVALLFIDLFIAVPTLTIIILAGYFLGFQWAAVSALLGVWLAGLTGYGLSRLYGQRLLQRIFQDPNKLVEMADAFNRNAVVVILLSRALPILPEVSCCLAGANKMPLGRFLMTYLVATGPYVVIATYAGSISTMAEPMPAIFTAIGLSVALWFLWLVFIRIQKRKAFQEEGQHYESIR